MEQSELEALFAEIKLPKEVIARLKKVCDQPEGEVEANWVHRLITYYMYSPQQIALQVPAGAGRNAAKNCVFADIVCYRDKIKKEPFIIIEIKKPNTTAHEGIKQAESYSRNLGADFHVWSDWLESKFFKTARFIDQSTPVGNIPSWAAGAVLQNYLSKTHSLPPFKNEEHLRRVVRLCHNKIFFNLGHDPAKSFDELMKVLFVKIYDERVTPQCYKFAILPEQTKEELGSHIRQLFTEAAKSSRYNDVFTTRFSKPGERVSLDLDDDTLYYVVEQFQSFSLVGTTSTLEGVDIKGTVFERMVGSTFRGELGAYFTPRELVEFCVQLVAPNAEGKVLDPACGSGGFLIMVIKYIKDKIKNSNPNLNEGELYVALKEYCDKNVFGVDINERMVRVAKMNMIMHGDGHAGIYNTHGLNIGFSDRLPIKENSIEYVFSNPPFAGRESDPSYLTRFESAVTDDGSVITLHKSIPFVELIIRLLAPGGIAALVLPNGIFTSPSGTFKKIRKIIFENTKILAIIGLPHWVFFHSGCDVQGSLLFLKKEKSTDDYNVFIDWADNVGYDSKGTKTEENDLPSIIQRHNKPTKANLFPISLLKKNDRLDPLFYRPGCNDAFFRKTSGLKLGDLVEPGGTLVSKSPKNLTKYKYLEVGGADPETGNIAELKEYQACELPGRAKYIVREGMVLLPNHRNSIASGRSPVLITEEHDGIVVTSRFIPLFCKVPPAYVFNLLNLELMKQKMLKTVTGSSSTEVKWNVIKEIAVPTPANQDYDTFLADIMEFESKISKYSKLLEESRKELKQKFTNLFT
ncbi:MAG: N-6 DNA methylase [Dehalogenimonas sp.]